MQFDQFAHSYEANAFIQKDLIEWAKPFINTIPLENKLIIEFGAGTGLLTKHLCKKKPLRIIATDNSPRMIAEGNKKIPEAQWELMDAWNANPMFTDHIFSSSLLQWCPDPIKIIANWAKYLPKGGSIHALFFIDQTLKELRELITLKDTPKWETLACWKSYFENSNLEIRIAREEIRTYNLESSFHLLRNLKYTGSSLKNKFCAKNLKRILKDYDKTFSLGSGVISTWHFCQLIAQK